jgi:hypothetical protein
VSVSCSPLAMDCLNLLALPHLNSNVEIHSKLTYKADSVTQCDNDFWNDVEYGTVTYVYIMFAWCSYLRIFNLSTLGSNGCQLNLPTNIHDHKDFFWVLFVILAWDESQSQKKYFTFGCLWINHNVVHFTELNVYPGLNHISLQTMGILHTRADQNQNDGIVY